MTERAKYRLRLIERYVDYDPDRGVHIFREWQKNAIVTDVDDIRLLEARGAPVERIDLTQQTNQRST
jgi:hypothetical protein